MRLNADREHLEVWGDLAEDEECFEEAVGEAEAALAADPGYVPARNNLGRLFALRGWWQGAVEQWEASLSNYPDQPQIREELLAAKAKLGLHD